MKNFAEEFPSNEQPVVENRVPPKAPRPEPKRRISPIISAPAVEAPPTPIDFAAPRTEKSPAEVEATLERSELAAECRALSGNVGYGKDTGELSLALKAAAEIFDRGGDARPDMADFKGNPYPEAEVSRDMAWTDVLSADFASRGKDRSSDERAAELVARALEEVIEKGVHEGKWFGEAHVSRSSLYDDYKNRTDLCLEFPTDGEAPLALSLDLTTSTNPVIVSKKVESQYDDVFDPEGTPFVKYFKSQYVPGYQGRAIRIPITIGLNASRAKDLITLTNGIETAASETLKKDRLAELAGHEAKGIMYEEIERQLEVMEKIFETYPQYGGPRLRSHISKIRKVVAGRRTEAKVPQQKYGTYPDPVEKQIITGSTAGYVLKLQDKERYFQKRERMPARKVA